MSADRTLAETLTRGWTLSRKTPAPIATPYGFRIDIGLPDHRTRHIVPHIDPRAFRELVASITAPAHFLKVYAAREEVEPFVNSAWIFGEPCHLMTRALVREERESLGPFHQRTRNEGSTIVVEILTRNDELAASGRAAVVDDAVVFDQIVTTDAFRRRGLGSRVMSELSLHAYDRGARRGGLVASEEGYFLYAALGWERISAYTSTSLAAN